MAGEPGTAEQFAPHNDIRIDRGAWEKALQATLRTERLRYEDGLSHNLLYMVPEDNGDAARKLTEQFHGRVEEVKKQHLEGPLATGGNALAVTLRFGSSDAIAPLNWKGEGLRPDDRWVTGRIMDVGQSRGWQGDIVVDFEGAGPGVMSDNDLRFGHLLRMLAGMKKRVLLVVDGYGEEALRKGFLMMQSFVQPFGDEYRQVLIRSAYRQAELDCGLGSPWINAQWDAVSTRSQPQFLRAPRPYDADVFAQFAEGIERAVEEVSAGGRPELIFPYGFGKTTMLRSLAGVMSGGVLIGEVGEGRDGQVMDLRTGRQYEPKGELALAVLNETGRETGERAVGKLEAAGVRVVRIRPPDEIKMVQGDK